MTWESEEVRGDTVEVGDLRVTPVAKADVVRVGGPGFKVFRESTRPVRVEVEGPDGRRSVTIPDRDRQLRTAVPVLLVVLVVLMILRERRSR